eukprot:TRINITY_DN3483_c1_g1_i6.p2 TRINITY_DN3483_c1_g1~~TRINITY_DN3483_c1_g1_i6.p2  ORF type:complete len:220 (+),score=-4.56 TRINITY_DN3483_c1_g1_i6:1056-1715(+)
MQITKNAKYQDMNGQPIQNQTSYNEPHKTLMEHSYFYFILIFLYMYSRQKLPQNCPKMLSPAKRKKTQNQLNDKTRHPLRSTNFTNFMILCKFTIFGCNFGPLHYIIYQKDPKQHQNTRRKKQMQTIHQQTYKLQQKWLSYNGFQQSAHQVRGIYYKGFQKKKKITKIETTLTTSTNSPQERQTQLPSYQNNDINVTYFQQLYSFSYFYQAILSINNRP